MRGWRILLSASAIVAVAGCDAGIQFDVSVTNATLPSDGVEVWIDGVQTASASATFESYPEAEAHPFKVELHQGGRTIASSTIRVDECNGCGGELHDASIAVCAYGRRSLRVFGIDCHTNGDNCYGDGACPPP